MNITAKEPFVVGCHHKTGTNLVLQFGRVIGEGLWNHEQIVWGKSEDRKLPLSKILERCRKGFRCYLSIWFEHEIDVPASSIRLLHFVRHPVNWVRSAYLYHKGGAVSDSVRWVEWRVFRVGKNYVSYQQLLHLLNEEQGVMLEAIRSYPEIAGTARAAQTSARLTMRQQISLEQLQSDFPSCVRTLAGFIGLDKETEARVLALRGQTAEIRNQPVRPNATHCSPRASHLEHYLMADPSFCRLYSEPARDMGFVVPDGPLRPESNLNENLLERMLSLKNAMITDARQPAAQRSLCSGGLEADWPVYALQAFGDGGHLMMYEFMKVYLETIDLEEAARVRAR